MVNNFGNDTVFTEDIDQEILDKICKVLPQKVAEDLCSVQPIDIDFKALMDDPIANVLASNFFARIRKEK